jgi:lipopolysaccharide export LptBFGC system permease protein LptF
MLIDRHIARQILLHTALAVLTLSSVLVVGNVLRDVFSLLLNKSVSVSEIAAFIGCTIPFALPLTIPWAFLTVLLLLFGRMSSDNELLALRSSGVSIVRTCRPVFVIAAIFCLLCFLINAELAPRARRKMREIIHSMAISALVNNSAPEQVIQIVPKMRIYIGRQNAGHLENIQIFELGDDSEVLRFISARKGRLDSDKAQDRLLIRLSQVTVDERDKADENAEIPTYHRVITAREYLYPIPFVELFSHSAKSRSPGSYTLRGLRAQFHAADDETNRSVYRTELNKRFSLSLASLAFMLVGVPLAITAHRRETTVGFGLGLLIGIIYYAFVMIADHWRGTPQLHPEIMIWTSNLVFIPLGILLFRRLAKR